MTVPHLTGVELAGDPSLPLLVVGPSLGTSATALWRRVAEELGSEFHVVGWDLPGHAGASVGRAFSMADLAAGVLGYADRVATARGDAGTSFVYAGDSVGGAVGLQLALDAPGAVRAAVLLCTGAKIGEAQGWHERAATVRASGTPVMVSGSAERWFAPGFLEREPEVGAALLHVLQDADKEGYAQVCEALADFDVRGRLGEIDVPVLAVAGAYDVATPVANLEEIVAGVRHGELLVLDDVAHLAPAEAPAEVASAICGLRDGIGALIPTGTPQIGDGADPYEAGMTVRRAVLGDAHVDRAAAATTDFTRDFQELITRYAWGSVWTRPGLDRRSRSMITLTALIALGHHEEFAMHVRAALTNGLSVDEIKEVVLQSAIYCGVPAANTAFRIAQQVLDEHDQS